MTELWRNIAEYKGMYQVSCLGRIRSFKNNKPRFLKKRKNKSGYYYVNLCDGGVYKSMSIHRLVACEFLGDSNLQVNHKNGNKENNTLENLEFVSRDENREHAKKNNLLATKEKNGSHKLTERDVKLMRFKYSIGKKMSCLSREFGVSKSVVRKIINYINWK